MYFTMSKERLREFFLSCLQHDSDDLIDVINTYDFGSRSALNMDLEALQGLLMREIDQKFAEVEMKYSTMVAKYGIKEIVNEVYGDENGDKIQ
jgi:hypothetical protein